MIELDVRGLSCPLPVVKAKQAMEKNASEEISVLLDSNVAKENIFRLAVMKKYTVHEEAATGDECRLVLTPAR
mgnify:CR=1 FL=1